MRHIRRRARSFPRNRRRLLACEALENRTLLAVTVDTLIDEADGSIVDGDVSLRDAIAVAPAGETINFDAALDGGTILLTLGELRITRSLTLDATSLSGGLTIDASGNDPTPDRDIGDGSRILKTNDGDKGTDSPVTISGLTLTGGDVGGAGGAIIARENLTLTNSTIWGNSARDGGGISASGDITVISSTISGNWARSGDGGIYGSNVTVTDSTISGNAGRGVSASGNVTVTNSTISGNASSGVWVSGDVAVTNSTISGNSVSYGNGGGIWTRGNVTVTSSTISNNDGGGIFAYGNVTATSSTISGNPAGGEGGGIVAGDNVTVISSTISGNSAGGSGGGIWALDNPVTIENSIVAGNTDNGAAPDIRPGTAAIIVRYSLIGDNTGTSLSEAPVGMPDANGNLIGGPIDGVIDRMLAPLADNGGPTQTHSLLLGSPAIDVGDPGFTRPPDFDQRGDPFARAFGTRIDMGAYERHTGDMDFDRDIDFDDIDAFALGIAFPLDYEQQYGAPPNANGDTDGDGDQDFDDIPGFVELLDSDPLVVGTQAVADAEISVQLVEVTTIDVPAFRSLSRRSISVGPWLTTALGHRKSTDQDRASALDRAPASQDAPHRILGRVMRSRDRMVQKTRGALPRVRPTAQGNSEKPTAEELAVVWDDDWDWLGRRPP